MENLCPKCGVKVTYNNRSGYTDLSWNPICRDCYVKCG